MKLMSMQPEKWQGRYLLKCTHALNTKSKIRYLMYCDIIKQMPDGRLKIKVYGERHRSADGEKIRYVDAGRVVTAEAYGVENQTGNKNGTRN
jgi:hypothetical protein